MERDDNFTSLGYTDPDTVIDRRAAESLLESHRRQARRSRRHRTGIGPQRGEEEGVGYEGGVPPYLQPHADLSAEQEAINLRGKALIDHQLAVLRDQRINQTSNGNAVLAAARLRAELERRNRRS